MSDRAERMAPTPTLLTMRGDSIAFSWLVWTLLFLSLVSWRSDTFYSGGLDPVVAAKGVLGLVTLALSWLGAPDHLTARVRPRTVLLVALYVLLSCLGAAATGFPLASIVLGVRVLMVLMTVLFLVLGLTRRALLAGLALSLGVLVVVLIPAGIGATLERGRLTGGPLPTTPNQMAMLCGPPALYVTWRLVRSTARVFDAAVLVLMLGLTWLTGSRTGLIALLAGMGLILLLTPRGKRSLHVIVALCLPAILFVGAFTHVFDAFFGRGGEEGVLTLSSRTIAWSAALHDQSSFYTHWFGAGLSVKTVAVTGTYWDAQVLDSSWLSSLVQAGRVGFVILAVWSLSTLWLAWRDTSPYRSLLVGLAVFALVRSFLENGLLDTYVLFAVMLVPALCCDSARGRGVGTPESSADAPTRTSTPEDAAYARDRESSAYK